MSLTLLRCRAIERIVDRYNAAIAMGDHDAAIRALTAYDEHADGCVTCWQSLGVA